MIITAGASRYCNKHEVIVTIAIDYGLLDWNATRTQPKKFALYGYRNFPVTVCYRGCYRYIL